MDLSKEEKEVLKNIGVSTNIKDWIKKDVVGFRVYYDESENDNYKKALRRLDEIFGAGSKDKEWTELNILASMINRFESEFFLKNLYIFIPIK